MQHTQFVCRRKIYIFTLVTLFLVGAKLEPKKHLVSYPELFSYPASSLLNSASTNVSPIKTVKPHVMARLSFEKIRESNVTGYVLEQVDSDIRVFDLKQLFAFDPDWQQKSPFVKQKNGFTLKVNIGTSKGISFPFILNSRSPIKISTRHGTVKQYLSSEETYRGELVGRYLIYRGQDRDILYRYDKQSKELREFVYVATKSSLKEHGEVIRWRFEGAKLSLNKNGSAKLIHSSNPSADLSKLADNGLQTRISRFLEKRNQPLGKEPIEKTLFVIPNPEFVDGNLDTLTKGIRYQVFNNELKLLMDLKNKLTFPLWVDPSLRADDDADVILDGQSGAVYGDQFGRSVASAGDFNGDGIDDVIVGATDTNNGRGTKGAYIFFGGTTGTKRADADADVIIRGNSDGENVGHSVASAGDFNGDGLDDVIIGAPKDDMDGLTDSGSAFIFFGGITGTKNAETDADVTIRGQNAHDLLGISVASAGDFNGDGLSDVIVGAHADDNNGEANSGSAFIFFGGITGTKTADANANVILNGQSSVDVFGISVASAGDFNGDGKSDVIVGAYCSDIKEASCMGSAYIFFGGITGTKRANADANVILRGQHQDDEFGRFVASAGDFNGDGFDDVIVGAHKDDNNGEANSGSAFIFFGGITGTKTADANANVILNGQSAYDYFGGSVASAGDFNGDGLGDVIVGASHDDNNGENQSGSAFIFFGGITGTKRADADADVILNGQSQNDYFGSSSGTSVASAGDFDGDGHTDDIIVGAFLDDNNGETSSGSAFIFFGSATSTILAVTSTKHTDIVPRPLVNRNSDQLAISPYAQAIPNDSYTFIGISHPSLRTAARHIGVALEVVGMRTTSNTPAGRSVVFTVSGGETHRVFVVNQGHKHINSSNAAFKGKRVHLIYTVDTPQFGSIRVSTVDEAPNIVRSGDIHAGTGHCLSFNNIQTYAGCGYETLNQLMMWGVIYSEGSGAGFSMEFIGDMQDSKLRATVSGGGSLKSGHYGAYIATGPQLGNAFTPQTRPGAGVN